MLSRYTHVSPCRPLYRSIHSASLPSLRARYAPIQCSPLRPNPWLSAGSLAICSAEKSTTLRADGRLGSWPYSGCLKRKRMANAATQEYDDNPRRIASIHTSTLETDYYCAVQGTRGAEYRVLSLACGPLVHSQKCTVGGKRTEPPRSHRNHAFTWRPIGTVSFSTIATKSVVGFQAHVSANRVAITPRRTMVSVKRGVQEVEGQWWWARSSRLSSPRRRTRNSVGGKVEKGSVTALGKSNEFVDRWSTALARIHTPNANQVSESSTEDSMSTLLVVEQDPSAIDNKDSIEYWVKSTRRHKIRTWEGKLISSLREKPPDILKILSANLESSGIFLPGRVVKDCLNHLAWLYLNTSTYTSSVYFEAIYRVVVNSLEIYREDSHSIALDQRTIRLLSKHCDADQLILFLEKLNKSAAFIHTNTRLHIMPKLVEYGKIGLALSMLKHMPPQDLLLDKVQMFCVKLLRANLEVEDLYRLRSNVLAFILEAGVRPNRFLANIIILNANEAGDLSTAWRSHTIAKENGLVPDAATYTALLKGVHHPNSQSTVRLVYRDAKLDGCLSKSSRLKFELLYALYISNSGKHNETPYSNLLPYYRQFFDIKPLQELGIIHSTGSSDEEEGQFSEPVVQALGLILLAWLIESHDNRKVLAVYERYRYHTQHNHSLIAQLAETEHTANAFTVAFGRSPRTVHICTQVVQDMLKAQVVRIDESHVPPSTSDVSHSDNDGIENIVEDSSLQHTSNVDLGNYKIRHIASPNVQTWSILLFAFVKHRQFNAAEKVLALMEARGQQPNIVTWNSLLSGYARLQDFPGIISTMERINQAGLATDEWTSKALARVVDRDLLLQTLEENTQKDINDMNGKQAMASI